MNRIFFPLALLAVLTVAGLLVMGLYLHQYDVPDPRAAEAHRLAPVHRLAGFPAGWAKA